MGSLSNVLVLALKPLIAVRPNVASSGARLFGAFVSRKVLGSIATHGIDRYLPRVTPLIFHHAAAISIRSVEGFLNRVDTSLKGNSNAGHTYGATLSREQRELLLEYLKTL